MKLSSSTPPIYLPDKNQGSVLRLGLQTLNKTNWIYAGDDLAIFQQHKTALREEHDSKCFQALPESRPAQEEFYDFLLNHLLNNPELHYRLDGDSLHNYDAKLDWKLADKDLWQASLWVAEDFCILQRISGETIMTAASVCSPSNWKLEEKIGKSIDFIHEPVPDYDDKLAERVDRLMEGLNPSKPMLRFNWSIQDGNELCWRSDLGEESVPADKYWRVERQTLLRLPQSSAVIFGIRIFLYSFEAMNKLDGFQDSLAELLQRLPEQEKKYKGLY